MRLPRRPGLKALIVYEGDGDEQVAMSSCSATQLLSYSGRRMKLAFLQAAAGVRAVGARRVRQRSPLQLMKMMPLRTRRSSTWGSL